MVNQSLAFKVNLGIGKYSSGDHYAVLGLPVHAEASQIRKRYFNIAKILHPDVYGKSPQESDRACTYLAKLVSPAYNTLMQERERVEYQALLKLIAKRLMKRGEGLEPQSDVARLLATAPNDLNYEKAVRSLAEMQYQSLDKALDYTGQLSELNLVYVLAQSGYKPFASPIIAVSSPTVGSSIKTSTSSTSDSSVLKTNSFQHSAYKPPTSSYRSSEPEVKASGNSQSSNSSQAKSQIHLAEQYIEQKQWAFALKELRAVLQLDPSSSKCHALLGLVYVKQNLNSMAKVSFQQALKLNPQEPLALQYLKQLNLAKDADAKAQKPQKGGFFGWLGGGS
ncbi:DnaJ domain-containing protein [Tumidithrix elongata RA019]|uniref:DnaJ domain-containing protein n=1 Tax=Tumidithrix elongata BACA0141 TaxID=2716417 RepID=A0AAW9Q302_9CYAN|nr:DnaJ domain-containing protein [Tumidithrix elongata RA019]